MKKSVLFVGTHQYYFIYINEFLKNNNIKGVFLARNLKEKNILKSNDIDENNIYYLPDKLDDVSEKNKLDISSNEFDEYLEFVYKKYKIRNIKKNFYKMCYKFINVIDDIYNEKTIDICIMENYLFFPNSLVKLYCDKAGKNKLFFENGYFRPNTVTIDNKGLNFENSLPRNKDFYLKLETENRNANLENNNENLNKVEELNVNKLSYIYSKVSNIIFWIMSLISYKYGFCRLSKYLGKSIKSNIYKFYYKNYYKEYNFDLDQDYIFIPFQVYDDSQILNFSPIINNMNELVEILITSFKSLKEDDYFKDTLIVFKEHPADWGRVNYNDLYEKYNDIQWVVFLKKYNTLELIKNSNFVITINSTVGIEALEKHKPVLTLGKAFYNIEDLVINNKSLNNLKKDILKINNFKVNKKLTNNFLYYLKEIYNVKGNRNNVTKENILPVIKEIMNSLD